MSAQRVVVSASAGRRRAAARAWLAEQRARDPLGALGLLVSDLGAAADLLHPLVLEGEAPALFNIYRFTPELLARQLARRRLAADRVGVAPPLSLRAIVGAVLHGERDALTTFGAAADTPGFNNALARTIDALRRHRVRPSRLAALGGAGEELARLLRAYEAALEQRQLVDVAALMNIAAEAPAPHPVLGRALLVVDAKLRDPCEAALLRALVQAGTEVSATVARGDERSLAVLASVGMPAPTDLDLDLELEASTALASLQTRLFDEGPALSAGEQPRVPSGAVEVFSAPSAELECVEVARRVVALAAQGVRADRVAVLMRRARPYVELLEDALRRAEVQMYPATGVLQPDPAGRAFLLLLECAAERLSAARFAEFLSLGQLAGAGGSASTGGDGQSGEEPVGDGVVSPARWERLLGDASVVGRSLDRWRRRLAGLRGQLAMRRAELDDDDSGPAQALERDLGHLRALERVALPLLEQLDALPEAATWSAWIARLVPLAYAALRQPTRVVDVLGELNPLGDAGPVERARVIEVLRDRLSELPRTPPTHRYGRVFVGTPDDARGMCFDTVFVVGLAERSFPDKVLQDPVLRDDARAALAAADTERLPLPAAADRRNTERLALRLAVGAARRRCVLSYPRLDLDQGRPRVPSFYLLEAWRAVTGELPRFESLVRHATQRGCASLERPYPDDPQACIDDQEFDLATLAQAQRLRREDPQVDLAGYLAHLHTHAHLIGALRAFFARSGERRPRSGRAFTGQDGLAIETGVARDALGDERLTKRPHGVTALERFADCPYRFYLHSVLRLRPAAKLASGGDEALLDPLTRGRIVHRVQYELLGALRQREELPLSPQRLAAALELLEQCFWAVADAVAAEIAPPVDVLWREQMQALLREMRGWLEREADGGGVWIPERFELSFGLRARAGQARDPASVDAPAALGDEQYKLRGAIDMVERRGSDGAVRITDHKTGAAPSERELRGLGGGRSLQRVLYGLAYEAMVPGAHVVEGRLYYCTERGGYREISVPLDERLRRDAQRLLGLVDDSIAQGRLYAVPQSDTTCRGCDYELVCGRDAYERAQKKARNERDGNTLQWLRSLRQVRR